MDGLKTVLKTVFAGGIKEHAIANQGDALAHTTWPCKVTMEEIGSVFPCL